MCCNPLVSVVMGTRYLRTDLVCLERAVQSILTQTCCNFEFLICDNGSTSEAVAFLNDTCKRDGRVRLIRRQGCLDLASKLNLCLGAARGKYIARMDDDDYSHRDRLEKQIDFLETESRTAFVGCNVALIQSGRSIAAKRFPPSPKVEDFYLTQPYIHPTLMFRKEALSCVGGYSESRYCLLCEDYDLLLRLYQAGFTGANLQEILFDYTIPTTGKGNRKMKHRFNEVWIRYCRFKDLGRLPEALPYVLKPVVVGMLPEPLLTQLKRKRWEGV